MFIQIAKESLREQFCASIDMLKNAIEMWPDNLWETKPKVFRMAFHTLFFLEYYLENTPDNFQPMLAISNNGEDDTAPARIYTKKELLEYLEFCRTKCKEAIDTFDEHNIDRRWTSPSGKRSINWFELMMYNMRHVQHHSAQLNMILRNEIDNSPDWMSRESDPGW